MKALIVRVAWIDLSLDAHKTWELRTRPTSIRGQIALIRQGSRQIEGVVKLVDVLPRFSSAHLADSVEFHHVPTGRQKEIVGADSLTPWVLVDAHRFSAPVPFKRPSRPFTWVDLDIEAIRAVQQNYSIPNRSDATAVQGVSLRRLPQRFVLLSWSKPILRADRPQGAPNLSGPGNQARVQGKRARLRRQTAQELADQDA